MLGSGWWNHWVYLWKGKCRSVILTVPVTLDVRKFIWCDFATCVKWNGNRFVCTCFNVNSFQSLIFGYVVKTFQSNIKIFLWMIFAEFNWFSDNTSAMRRIRSSGLLCGQPSIPPLSHHVIGNRGNRHRFSNGATCNSCFRWFVRFAEFMEYNESSSQLRENSNVNLQILMSSAYRFIQTVYLSMTQL